MLSLIVFSLLSRALAKRVQQSSLGALDRTLGLLYGLVRGAVIVSLLWLAFTTWLLPAEDHPAWLREAKTRPLIDAGADTLIALVPGNLRRQTSRAVESALQNGDKALETGRIVQELLQPKTASEQEPAAKNGASDAGAGYTEGQREQLDQAIEALQ